MDEIFAAIATGGTTANIGSNQMAFTIYDQDGIDTVDLSFLGTGEVARINLNDGTFSDIGAGIGVMAIAAGTVVENLHTGAGNDNIIGNEADNLISSNAGNDNINAGAGNDHLIGGIGNDILNGDVGDDTIEGSEGNDVITGGEGNDNLSGGTGTDTFIFREGFGQDVVADFDADSGELIDLSGIASASTVVVTQAGSDTIIEVGDGGETITLTGVDKTGLSENQFEVAPTTLEVNEQSREANGVGGTWWAQREVLVADVNGDQRADIIGLTGNSGSNIGVWLGQDDGTFSMSAITTNSGIAGSWWGAREKHVADVNGDGNADIIGLTGNSGSNIGVWLGQDDGTFSTSAITTNSGIAGSWWGAREKHVADVNGDGNADIIGLTGNSGSNIGVWLGQDDGTFSTSAITTNSGIASSWWEAREKHVADVNGDGNADIIGLTGNSGSNIGVWLGQDDGSFVESALIDRSDYANASWAGRDKYIADIDGDGRGELIGLAGTNGFNLFTNSIDVNEVEFIF